MRPGPRRGRWWTSDGHRAERARRSEPGASARSERGGPAPGLRGGTAPGLRGGDAAVAWRNRAVLLFDHLPMPMAVCDTDGVFLLANPAMAAEWATLPGRLHGQNALDLFRPRETTQLHPIVEAVRLRRRSRYPVEVLWTTADGVRRHGELVVDVVGEAPDAQAALLVFLHVLGDVEQPAEAEGGDARVSPVEARILALVAGGGTTAQMAKAVGMTADGVNYHLQRLSRRWGSPNRTALVARAYVLGVLRPRAWPPGPGTAAAP
ncbi:helix-turn-helix transcriptional regulator [Saccharopolyspora erythraea]|uniref:helix-turn-helix transcriptional regulator n=1 Tax=Saccharopolyspora erythraea TaxID=1836 RepID=UPI00038D047F|nr:PAS domain-containing protein [Saccharopolyspora erythraea]EQD86895.1 diguanylate cyclase [Saccharopolyspora erythraea D]QRK87372.1 PAS domain-containing protein [Saccharopolyspora erythraea]